MLTTREANAADNREDELGSLNVEPLNVDIYALWMPHMKVHYIGKDQWCNFENRGNSKDDKKKPKHLSTSALTSTSRTR